MMILEKLIILFEKFAFPKPILRESSAQLQIDKRTAMLSLYQFTECPFCVKVRREIQRHALQIEMRDIHKNKLFKQELIEGGGKSQVPCLRIDNTTTPIWLYESNDIIDYLNRQILSGAHNHLSFIKK